MKKCKVLDEANGISDTIDNFNLEDKNQYHKIKNSLSRKNIKHLVTIARGSSDSAALFASYLFAKSLGITTYSLPPSIITHEKSKFDFSKTLVLIISLEYLEVVGLQLYILRLMTEFLKQFP